jgi:hypothetical protein
LPDSDLHGSAVWELDRVAHRNLQRFLDPQDIEHRLAGQRGVAAKIPLDAFADGTLLVPAMTR